jgi:hypothetical protein
MKIRKETKFYADDFEITFEPIEDTIEVEETKDGYKVKYLICDDSGFDLIYYDLKQSEDVLLVNYHRDFYVERPEIISKEEVIDWYNCKKIPQEKKYFIFTLYCLVHSGVYLSIDGFSPDPYYGFDTSRVGIVLVSKKLAKNREKAREIARNHIDIWNKLLSGEVYCAVVETYNKNKEHIDYDTIGGIVGSKEALEELKSL